MKNEIIIFTLIFSFLLINNFTKAQCKQQFVYSCSAESKAIFLREFNATIEKTSDEYDNDGKTWTVVLNKGTHYRFNLCVPDSLSDKVYLKLWEFCCGEYGEYGSTWEKYDEKDYYSFDFVCQVSRIYNISIRFKDDVEIGTETCVVGILSFVEKKKK